MKKIFLLFFLFSNISFAEPVLTPTEELEAFFQDNGMPYQKYGNFSGVTNATIDSETYLFLDYPDPGINRTLGLFFEFTLNTGLSVDPNMHLAAGLRGPIDWVQPGSPLSVTHGRGIAIGQLWSNVHPGCGDGSGPEPYPIRGFFIEDFTASVDGDENTDIHATDCKPILMPDYSIYRVDIHVSRLNATVAVWRKTFIANYGFTYTFVGDLSCIRDSLSYCPIFSQDSGIGNAFITVAGGVPGLQWSAFNIYMADWDS